jgi:uncharacterized membrane protein
VGHQLSDGLVLTARDARNRSKGAAATLRSRFRQEEPDDEVVEQRIREQQSEVRQENWAPATRLLVGGLGGLLALEGARTKGSTGSALSLLGLGILARAVTNQPALRLVRGGAGRGGIDVRKTIAVAAPLDRVWQLWSNFGAFPRFMSHLREIRKIDEGRSHWVASGPAGVPIEWDAVITDWVPEHLISWKSVERSTIETTGSVRFRDLPGQLTEIDVQLSYVPPAGVVGHAIAAIFGDDPKRAMDDDMGRLKALLEEGSTRSEGDPVQLEEVTTEPEPRRTKSSGRQKKSTQREGD